MANENNPTGPWPTPPEMGIESAPKPDKKHRRTIVSSDMDERGNVVVWDHGPSKVSKKVPGETDEQYKARTDAAAADAKLWNETHIAPDPLTMHASDAAHAIGADERYAMEPADLDESAVEAEIKKIQDERAKVAAAAQLAADRKVAIARVMAAKRAKAKAEKAKADA